MSCGVGRTLGSDLTLLWLWCRPAAAALIRPLAWKLPYAAHDVVAKERERAEAECFRKFQLGTWHRVKEGRGWGPVAKPLQ